MPPITDPEILKRIAGKQNIPSAGTPHPKGQPLAADEPGTSFASAVSSASGPLLHPEEDATSSFFADESPMTFTREPEKPAVSFPAPASGTEKPVEAPPVRCLHCGQLAEKLEGPEPTEAEKVQFQHCVLPDEVTPFERVYFGFGGALEVTFRSISFDADRKIRAKVYKEYGDGVLTNAMEVMQREQDLWLGGSVLQIRKKLSSGWKTAYRAPESVDGAEDEAFKAVVAAVKSNAALVDVLFRLRSQFTASVSRLELAITDPNFWPPVG